MNARHPMLFGFLLAGAMAACSDEPTGPARVPNVERGPEAVQQALEEKRIPSGMTRETAMELIQMQRARDVRSVLSQNLSVLGPLAWEDSWGSPLNQSDDDCDRRNIGFDFEFYGIAYSDVYINSNGNLSFGACNRDWHHPDIPDGSNRLIAPLYGDFNPSASGDVLYNLVGSAPNRRFVVTWAGVPEYFNDGSNTFQAILYETSNDIQFAYAGLTTDGINWAFGSPSTDGAMDVGISSGAGAFINSASGAAIPSLDGANICYRSSGDAYIEVSGPCITVVAVDVKPGDDENAINCTNDRGIIPVAILSTDSFDANSVDHTTVRFVGAEETHTDRRSGAARRHEEDVDADGDLDLVFHFRYADTELSCGASEGQLYGLTFDGQAVRGTDGLRMVGGQLLTAWFADPEGDHLQFDPARRLNPPSGVADAVGLRLTFDNATGEYEILVTASPANPFAGWTRVTVLLFNPDTGTTSWDPSFFRTFDDQYFADPSTSMRFSGVDSRLVNWEAGDRVAPCEGTSYEELGPCLGGLGLPDGVRGFGTNAATYGSSAPQPLTPPKGIDFFFTAPAAIIGS